MNPGKRDYNGWILCPSTRFPGKYYYFNMVTGAAAWHLSDIEQRMVPRTNCPQADKWHSYPEPDCPPLDDSNPFWNCQPDYQNFNQSAPIFSQPVQNSAFWNVHSEYQTFNQPASTFGQAAIPKYAPNMIEAYPQSTPWSPKLAPKFPNRLNFDSANPWAGPKHLGDTTKRDAFPKKSFGSTANAKVLFNNQGFGQPFRQKASQNNSGMFMSNQEKDVKKWSSKAQLGPGSFLRKPWPSEPNIETISRPQSLFQPNGGHACNCPCSQSHENLAPSEDSSIFTKPKVNLVVQKPQLSRSKSMENITNTLSTENIFLSPEKNYIFPKPNKQNHLFNSKTLDFADLNSSSKSMENVNSLATDKVFFSPEMSFIFPKPDNQNNLFNAKTSLNFDKINSSKTSLSLKRTAINTNGSNSTKIVKPAALNSTKKPNSTTVTNSTKTLENNDGEELMQDLSESDLRYVLLAKRKTTSSESHFGEGKKIKTSYTESQLAVKEFAPKKRVTFDLGVENKDENKEDEIGISVEKALKEEIDPSRSDKCYLIPDTDVLLNKIELIEKFVQTDDCYRLLVPQSVLHDVNLLSGVGGGSSIRRDVITARRLLKEFADPPDYLIVQTSDPEPNDLTDDPILSACIQVLNEGYQVNLISDNKDLATKASVLDIECYTSNDVEDDLANAKPEVSFDKQNDIEENMPKAVPKNRLLDDDYEDEEIDYNLVTDNNGNQNCFQRMNQTNQNHFLDQDELLRKTCELRNEFKNLALSDNHNRTNFFKKIVYNNIKNQLTNEKAIQNGNVTVNIDSKKQMTERQLFKNRIKTFTQNGVDSKQDGGDNGAHLEINPLRDESKKNDGSTIKKKKIKNVNFYNLNELLKNFREMSNKDMEERIAMRMDEWVCSFSQILEDTLLEALPSLPSPLPCGPPRPPLREALQSLREARADHRTLRALADRLGAALDHGYHYDQRHDRLVLCMKPNEFVKMFGCGSLLITCLRNIDPENAALEEGERLLEQLLHRIEESGHQTPQLPSPVPVRIGEGFTDPPKQPVAVKDASEVLEYLKKHFQNKAWEESKGSQDAARKMSGTVKVIRVTGKDVGSLKLLKEKTATTNRNSKTEESTDVITNNTREAPTGPKLIKELALKPSRPPKMKEIDIEKREEVNKEITDMIEKMLEKKPKSLTHYYNLDSIIIKKSNEATTEGKVVEKADEMKLKNNKKPTMKYPIIKSPEKSSDSKSDNENKNKVDDKENEQIYGLDLDVLDYTEMEKSIADTEGISSSDSENLNNVPTTGENEINNDAVDINNEVNDIKNKENNINDNKIDANVKIDAKNDINDLSPNDADFSNTSDSGFETDSVQAYSFVQMFLRELCGTLKNVFNFVKQCRSELRSDIPASRKLTLTHKASNCHTLVTRVISNLRLIVSRECGTARALSPRLQAHADRRLRRYRAVITKCLEQARLLRVALSALQHAISGTVDNTSSDTSSLVEYFNIFE